MADIEPRWSWLETSNIDKSGRPFICTCWQCRKKIEVGEPRAINNHDRKPTCERCAIDQGCPPVEEAKPKKMSASGKPAPSLMADESAQIIPLLVEIRDLLKQMVNQPSGLNSKQQSDFSPPLQDPVHKLPEKKEELPVDPRWIAVLERLEDIARPTADLMEKFGRVESWTDQEVVISMPDMPLTAMNDTKRGHLHKAMEGQPYRLKSRSF